MFNKLENEVDLTGPFTINWSAKGIGFGQLTFSQHGDKLYCDNEGMSKDFIKQVLCNMVDQCELFD